MWDVTGEYRGKWWPAGLPEHTFSGVLRLDDRRPRLTLAQGSSGQSVSNLAHAQTIHGKLESGENVTLWDVQDHAFEHLRGDDEAASYRQRYTYAILGEHLPSHGDARFRFSAYRLHGLSHWSAMEAKPITRGLTAAALPHYEPASLPNFHRDESGVEYSAKVRFENLRRIEEDPELEGAQFIADHTGDQVRVIFECTPPAPPRVHDHLLHDLQALLTFSYQGGAPIEAQWLALQKMESAFPVMQRDSFNGDRPFGREFSMNMVLTTELMEPAELFPAWWKVMEDLYPAVEVIYLYHHGSRGLLESSVAAAIAVAEHLHGMIGPTKTRFPTGFLANKKLAVKHAGKFAKQDGSETTLQEFVAEPAFREFLYEAFNNDRPALRTRLEELADAVTSKRLALLNIDGEQWIGSVLRVRNPIAHTSSHVKRRGDDSSNLLRQVNTATRAIVSILILKRMGMSEDVLDKCARVLGRALGKFLQE